MATIYDTFRWRAARARALKRDSHRCTVARSETGQFAASAEPLDRLLLKTAESDRGYKSYCWTWTAPLNNWGYGTFWLNGNNVPAHRAAYQLLIGAIPDGFVIDHLCGQSDCVNPEHLEAVEESENIRRGTSPSALNAAKTHCDRGHEFSLENTYLHDGARYCRACRIENGHLWNVTEDGRKKHREREARRKLMCGGAAWQAARSAALERDNHRCTVAWVLGGRCSPRLHVHHLIPLEEGGEPYALENLITICARHHPSLESIRRHVLDEVAEDARPPRCPHTHRSDEARRACEARMARQRSRVAA